MLKKKSLSGDLASIEKDNERFSFVLNCTNSGIWDWDLRTQDVFFDENYFKIAGYAPNEFAHTYENWEKRVHPNDLCQVKARIKYYLQGISKEFSVEFRFKTKSGDWLWLQGQGKISEYDDFGNPVRFTGTQCDINDRKQAEHALKIAYETLEKKFREQTAELEEINTAFKVLFQKRKKEKQDIEEKILANFKFRVSPTLDLLKKNLFQKKEYPKVELLEFEIKDIVSCFAKDLSQSLAGLTPTEIQIASMIKQGKSNKDMSALLCRSTHTIANHRESIRKKLGLKNQKINLRSYLTAL